MKDSKYRYQIVAVLNPKTEEKEKETILKKIADWVESKKAQIVKKEHMGSKDLVYEIQKLKKGDFWVMDVESDAAMHLNEFNLFLNREPNIIRYLILKK
jgi:ribosomal protein S6